MELKGVEVIHPSIQFIGAHGFKHPVWRENKENFKRKKGFTKQPGAFKSESVKRLLNDMKNNRTLIRACSWTGCGWEICLQKLYRMMHRSKGYGAITGRSESSSLVAQPWFRHAPEAVTKASSNHRHLQLPPPAITATLPAASDSALHWLTELRWGMFASASTTAGYEARATLVKRVRTPFASRCKNSAITA